MVWRAYYLIKKDNYLKISTLLICVFSVFAIILNIEGSNCIIQINSSPLSENSSNDDGGARNNNDLANSGLRVQQQLQGGLGQAQDANTQSQEELMQQSYELRKYCFLVTNLYVYSLFGIIIGFIVLVLWYMRYKKIWSRKKNGSNNQSI